MAEGQRFVIRRPEVIHEILDDELVIVNLKTGSYFSLDRVGAVVWRAIDRHASHAEIVADVEARYQGASTDIAREVARLLAELEAQALIAPLDAAAEVPHRTAPAAGERLPFSPPQLQKYTDMQELLLLDPVHEVDEQGWPIKKDAD